MQGVWTSSRRQMLSGSRSLTELVAAALSNTTRARSRGPPCCRTATPTVWLDSASAVFTTPSRKTTRRAPVLNRLPTGPERQQLQRSVLLGRHVGGRAPRAARMEGGAGGPGRNRPGPAASPWWRQNDLAADVTPPPAGHLLTIVTPIPNVPLPPVVYLPLRPSYTPMPDVTPMPNVTPKPAADFSAPPPYGTPVPCWRQPQRPPFWNCPRWRPAPPEAAADSALEVNVDEELEYAQWPALTVRTWSSPTWSGEALTGKTEHG